MGSIANQISRDLIIELGGNRCYFSRNPAILRQVISGYFFLISGESYLTASPMNSKQRITAS